MDDQNVIITERKIPRRKLFIGGLGILLLCLAVVIYFVYQDKPSEQIAEPVLQESDQALVPRVVDHELVSQPEEVDAAMLKQVDFETISNAESVEAEAVMSGSILDEETRARIEQTE